MAKITKTIADEMADSMVADYDSRLDALNAEQSSKAEAYAYDKFIPKEAVALFKAFPAWAENCSRVFLYGNGCKFTVSTTNRIPSNDSYQLKLNLDEPEHKEFAEDMEKRRRLIEDVKNERNQLILNIYETLLSLGTDKRVRASFPEAIPHLPSQFTTYTAVAVDLTTIREGLGKYQKDTEKKDA